jgi:hypothetical protein
LSCEPRPRPAVDVTEPYGMEELLMLDGAVGGNELSIKEPLLFAKSALLPANSTVKFGEARARASFRKLLKPVKVLWEVIS